MRLKKNTVLCVLLVAYISLAMVIGTNVAYAAGWPENISGRWVSNSNEFTEPSGRTWYTPGNIHEIQVTGNRIQIIIIAFGIGNRNHQDKRNSDDFLSFRGTIDGNRASGTSYSWSHSGNINDRLETTTSYPDTRTIVLNGDKLYFGDLTLTRE
jgi:hypothetical protein